MIREVEFAEATKIARDNPVAPVVYFTASWCQPCKQMKPQFARAGVRDSDRDYLIVDIDTVPQATLDSMGIRSVPTILVMEQPGNVTPILGRKTEEILAEVALS